MLRLLTVLTIARFESTIIIHDARGQTVLLCAIIRVVRGIIRCYDETSRTLGKIADTRRFPFYFIVSPAI